MKYKIDKQLLDVCSKSLNSQINSLKDLESKLDFNDKIYLQDVIKCLVIINDGLTQNKKEI